MAFEDRRERERLARRTLIVTTARKLAETEGWDAVTTRRLSTEVEYSQPVLYKHFSGMDQIAAAVAVEGFGELAETIRHARAGSADDLLNRIGHAYLDFARDNPAVYDAMFTRATTLTFATDDTPAELIAAFRELRLAVGAGIDDAVADTRTEVFWAALHGLVTLGRTGRLRAHHQDERLTLLVTQFSEKITP